MAAAARRKCSKCGLNRAIKFYSTPNARVCDWCQRARRKTAARKQHLGDTYAISQEEYDQILEAQGGGCAICGKTPVYSLQVDHDHKIERALIEQGYSPPLATRMSVRGLLDKPCNRRLLPAAGDSVEILRNAIQYLEAWPAHDIISKDGWVQ